MRGFSAYVEVGSDQWCTVWIGELLGFFLNEASEREALYQLPQAMTAYLGWLRRHGESVEVPRTVSYRVVARELHRARLAFGGYRSLFSCDRVPVTLRDLEDAFRWMGYMRQDLGKLMQMLPPEGMDWRRRPQGAMTTKQYLQHVASAERWYLRRFHWVLPRLERAPNVVERLARVRILAVNKLRGMTEEERSRVFKSNDHSYWSARKVLGRLLYHERYHIRSIVRIGLQHGLHIPDGLGGWHRYD